MSALKTLLLDIEMAPNLAHVWDLWRENVGLSQLQESAEMLCFAAKWYGDEQMMFHSQFLDGKPEMTSRAFELLDTADVTVHYNGTKFDIPHLNREFLEAGYGPPSPFQQIDLLKTVKKQFRFPTNKLAYVSQQLGLGGKVQHEGHELWVRCMAGEADAWQLMREYNEQDVHLLEALYRRLLPWIVDHPTVGLYRNERASCPTCGGQSLQRRGFLYTKLSAFQRYVCTDCGRWSRATSRSGSVDIT